MANSPSTDSPEKRTGCGCIRGVGNALGCLLLVAVILGAAFYVVTKQPALVQEFLNWIDAQQ